MAVAGHLARDLGAGVTLLCVRGRGRREERRACQGAFELAAPYLESVPVDTLIRVGQPAEEILREAESRPYDLLVVGEKGHHTAKTRFLLGATTERLANRAHVPVLVVKGDPEAGPPRPIRRILTCAALHDRARAQRLLGHLAPFARGTGAEVTLLHVMSQLPIPPVGAPDDWQATTETLLAEGSAEGEMLEQDLAILRDSGVSARPLVRHGLVVDEVLAESEAGDYDLVVIGGHEPGDWLHNLLLENVALQILHHARRSVLTVHG